MFDIYQRFNAEPAQNQRQANAPGNTATRPNNNPRQQPQYTQHQNTQNQQNQRPTQPQNSTHHAKPKPSNQNPPPPQQPQKRHIRHGKSSKNTGVGGIINRFLPSSVYNPETKKILGILTAEDLLLVALIFLFLDNDDEDNWAVVLALAFVLLSDYIDLSSLNL